jgi:hypothetical protein
MRPKSKRLYRNHPQNQSRFGSQPQFSYNFIQHHPTSCERVLDLDRSFSETIGKLEGVAYDRHFDCGDVKMKAEFVRNSGELWKPQGEVSSFPCEAGL